MHALLTHAHYVLLTQAGTAHTCTPKSRLGARRTAAAELQEDEPNRHKCACTTVTHTYTHLHTHTHIHTQAWGEEGSSCRAAGELTAET